MAMVSLSFSMSLVGFVAGPDISPDQPMGVGGERLHHWLGMGDAEPNDIDRQMAREQFAAVGAVVLGRTTFDVGLKPWGDTPYPAPSFVLTHEPRARLAMKSASFEFVSDGIVGAVSRARAAAGGRDVVVMGASVARQCLEGGFVDEIIIQTVPVLLGAGTRLFDRLARPVELETVRIVASPSVIHQRFRVRRS